jgi:hypothetical protein
MTGLHRNLWRNDFGMATGALPNASVFFMFTGRKRAIDRWEGVLFLLMYALFLGVKILFV